ncbi:MAG: malectin domain-containing carbohydrate-binding protein, partial [candidate division KSB1 bacterium]|nr:malectin domain-containing carbohydrate-binding protein [candidate division KSB1 bacterium]
MKSVTKSVVLLALIVGFLLTMGSSASSQVVRVNAGGPAYTDVGGKLWSADQPYTPGSWGYVGGNSTETTDPIANTDDDPLFQKYRYSTTTFSYQFDLPDGFYKVRMLFVEPWWTSAGNRIVFISLECNLMIDDWDIYAEVGHDYATERTFTIEVNDGQLNLNFFSQKGLPLVSAIEVSRVSWYEVRVNAGGPNYTDTQGKLWSADQAYTSGSWGYVGGASSSTTDPIANTDDDPLYQKYRYSQTNFSYQFDVPNGFYEIALLFVEPYWQQAGKRKFDVLIEGTTVLNDFDIFFLVGHDHATSRSFSVEVSDGQLKIDFQAVEGFPIVSAIRVTQTPCLQVRVNAGGPFYTDVKGNLWYADQPYSPNGWGYVKGTVSSTTDPIANTDDDPLYQKYRYSETDFSYQFDLPNGLYEITLFFIEPYWTKAGQRIFDVSIEGTLVLNNLDIFAEVGHDYATSKRFTTTVSDRQLNIKFTPEKGFPLVMAIEILGNATMTVLAPDGGERWLVGSTHKILWTSACAGDNVKIEYSSNGGTTWTTVVASTPNDGSHPWTIPNTPSGNCLVKITDVDGHPSDQTDVAFKIFLGPKWAVAMTITGDGITFTRTFGGAPSATDSLDFGLDIPTAPPGMTYYAYFYTALFPTYLDTDIRAWVSPYGTNIDWTLKIVNATGKTSTLSWKPDDLPYEGSFTLVGGGLNVNMRSQNSATVTGNATLTIQYRPVFTVTYNFPQPAWYLISLPVTPVNNSLSTLFPTALMAFGWNPLTGYYSTTTLDTKKGYWLLIPGATTNNVTGTAVNSYTEHYLPGWHLIGSVMNGVDFTNPDDNPDGAIIATYGYNSVTMQYYPAIKLDEKKGYWIAVAQECDLTVGGIVDPLLFKVASSVEAETFYQRFGSEPPLPPFLMNQNQALPTRYTLSQNYPNPFNPETVIQYSLPKAGMTRLFIYNALGQRIRMLVEAPQPAGIYQVVWDGRDENGQWVASGLYFYKLSSGDFVEVKKMLLLK